MFRLTILPLLLLFLADCASTQVEGYEYMQEVSPDPYADEEEEYVDTFPSPKPKMPDECTPGILKRLAAGIGSNAPVERLAQVEECRIALEARDRNRTLDLGDKELEHRNDLERERLQLERERLQLEREKLELERRRLE